METLTYPGGGSGAGEAFDAAAFLADMLHVSGEAQPRLRVEAWNAYNDEPADPGVQLVFTDGTIDSYSIGHDGYGSLIFATDPLMYSETDLIVLSPTKQYSDGRARIDVREKDTTVSAVTYSQAANLTAVEDFHQATVDFLQDGSQFWSIGAIQEEIGSFFITQTIDHLKRLKIDPAGPATFYPPDSTSAGTVGALVIDAGSLDNDPGQVPVLGVKRGSTTPFLVDPFGSVMIDPELDEYWNYGWLALVGWARGTAELADASVLGVTARAEGDQPDHYISGLRAMAVYTGDEKHSHNAEYLAAINAVTYVYDSVGGAAEAAAIVASGYLGGGLTVDNFYGLVLQEPSVNGGASITNRYGIYQEDPLAENVFVGGIRQGTGTRAPFEGMHIGPGHPTALTTEVHASGLDWPTGYYSWMETAAGYSAGTPITHIFLDTVDDSAAPASLKYGIYQADPDAKNVFFGQVLFGSNPSHTHSYIDVNPNDGVSYADLVVAPAMEGTAPAYGEIYSDAGGYGLLSLQGGLTGQHRVGLEALLDGAHLYMTKTTTAPDADSNSGLLYVAADGSLHYRGPTTDTQLAAA